MKIYLKPYPQKVRKSRLRLVKLILITVIGEEELHALPPDRQV